MKHVIGIERPVSAVDVCGVVRHDPQPRPSRRHRRRTRLKHPRANLAQHDLTLPQIRARPARIPHADNGLDGRRVGSGPSRVAQRHQHAWIDPGARFDCGLEDPARRPTIEPHRRLARRTRTRPSAVAHRTLAPALNEALRQIPDVRHAQRNARPEQIGRQRLKTPRCRRPVAMPDTQHPADRTRPRPQPRHRPLRQRGLHQRRHVTGANRAIALPRSLRAGRIRLMISLHCTPFG